MSGKTYSMLKMLDGQLRPDRPAFIPCVNGDMARRIALMGQSMGYNAKIRAALCRGIPRQPFSSRRNIWVEFLPGVLQ